MAGYQEDVSQWRLRAVPNGVAPIPYKFLGMDGGFNWGTGSIVAHILIPSNRLQDFLDYIFPPPVVNGFFERPDYVRLPGNENMAATDVSFFPFDDGKPIDPFDFDSAAPTGTYHELIRLDVVYNALKSPFSEPQTFLEITGNVTGEFIHTTQPGGHYERRRNFLFDADGDGVPETNGTEIKQIYQQNGGKGDVVSAVIVDPATGEEIYTNILLLDDEEIKNPHVPVTLQVPMIEWTVRYPRMNYEFFRDVFVHRLRVAAGKVNLNPVAWLYDAPRHTLLFMGYALNEQSTWRRGFVNKPPVTVEMKIVEKCIDWYGDYKGHNDVWKPGVGWERLLDQEDKFQYQDWDFDRLFKQD